MSFIILKIRSGLYCVSLITDNGKKLSSAEFKCKQSTFYNIKAQMKEIGCTIPQIIEDTTQKPYGLYKVHLNGKMEKIDPLSILEGKSERQKYQYIHWKISIIYGKATKCESLSCKHKTPQRFEWALIKGRQYSLDASDYIQLCPSCHRKYDMTDEIRKSISASHIGKRMGRDNPAARKVIDTRTGVIYHTVREAADTSGFKRTTLIAMLKGRNNTKTTLKYYTE